MADLEGLRTAMGGPPQPVCIAGCWVTVEAPYRPVGLAAGDYVTGPEYLSAEDVRSIAAALIAGAEWVEAQL